MESHVLAILEFSNKTKMLVPLVHLEPTGMGKFVTVFLLKLALLVTSSTKTSINASPQHLHVETMLTTTELPVSASLDSISSMEFVKAAQQVPFLMVLNAHQQQSFLLPQKPAEPIKSLLVENVSVTQGYT